MDDDVCDEVKRLRCLLHETRCDLRAGFAVVIFFLVLLVSNSFRALR
jgi:hypothetical protein